MPASSRLLRTERRTPPAGGLADRLHGPYAELHERRAHHQRHERERHGHRGGRGEAAQPQRRHQVAADRHLGVAGPAAHSRSSTSSVSVTDTSSVASCMAASRSKASNQTR